MLRIVVALLLAMLGADAWAQGIGDVAKREREKRRAAGTAKEPYVYDNRDLRKEEPPKSGQSKADANSQEPAESAPPVGAESDSGPSEFEVARARVAEAQKGLAEAEATLAKLEARIKGLQDRLNPMSPSFVYGQPNAADPMAEEARTRDDLSKAEAELPGARQAVEDARKALDDARLGRNQPSGG
jgi:chromosome segregation ATPase